MTWYYEASLFSKAMATSHPSKILLSQRQTVNSEMFSRNEVLDNVKAAVLVLSYF